MTGTADPETLVLDYCALQQRLLAHWIDATAPASGKWRFEEVPRLGSFACDNAVWSYRRHGVGVAFKSPDGLAVDPHRRILDVSDGVDGWRFWKFCDARGLDQLTYDGALYAIDYRELERMLAAMERRGVLEFAESETDMFRPAVRVRCT